MAIMITTAKNFPSLKENYEIVNYYRVWHQCEKQKGFHQRTGSCGRNCGCCSNLVLEIKKV